MDRSQALDLLSNAPLLELGRMAFLLKQRLYGNQVTFVRNLQINPTNRCVGTCAFCIGDEQCSGELVCENGYCVEEWECRQSQDC